MCTCVSLIKRGQWGIYIGKGMFKAGEGLKPWVVLEKVVGLCESVDVGIVVQEHSVCLW